MSDFNQLLKRISRIRLKEKLNKAQIFFINNTKICIYIAWYLFILAISSIFIVIQWNKCINMQFFTSFNGYNIIFLLWLIIIVGPLVNNKWFNFNIFNNMEKEKLKIIDNKQAIMKTEIRQADFFDKLAGENLGKDKQHG